MQVTKTPTPKPAGTKAAKAVDKSARRSWWLHPEQLQLRLVLVLDTTVGLAAKALMSLGLKLPIWLKNRLASRALAARLMPSALGLVSRGRRVVLITGSNGKTTTTAMLAAALGGDVATNSGNRNTFEGLLDTLLHSDASTAVLEVDELWLVEVLQWLTPTLLVVLNLVEDSWASSADPQYVLRRWRQAFGARNFAVLAWGEHPSLAGLFQSWPPELLHWFCQAQASANSQVEACPACGGVLRRQANQWSCRCGLRHPAAVLSTAQLWQLNSNATTLRPPLKWNREPLAVACGLPGQINRRNAAMALAAALLLGEASQPAQSALRSLQCMPMRDQCLCLAGREMHLLVVKNPTAWIELLDRLDGYAGLILVQHQTAKPIDLSWLYDLPIGALQGQRIGICGQHALDLAVWLTYAELDWIAAPTPHTLLERMPPGPLLCISDLLGAHWLVTAAEQS